jgi:hypothetical protein
LLPVDRLVGDLRLLIAARLGRPRLLDNLGVTVPEETVEVTGAAADAGRLGPSG